jgi:hypothetical protein
MHRKILGSLIASLALAACAHQPLVSADADVVWSLSHAQDGRTALRLRAPQADAPLLALSCEPHSGDVDITVSSPDARLSLVRLMSEPVGGRYIMEVGMGPEGQPILAGATRSTDPVLTRFAETGDLVLTAFGHGHALPIDQDKAAAFVAACRR